MVDDIGDSLSNEARRLGLTNIRITRGKGKGRRHPQLRAELAGVAIVHAYPGTPGDYRSERNCICEFRRRIAALKMRHGAVATPSPNSVKVAAPAHKSRRRRRPVPPKRSKPARLSEDTSPSRLDLDWRAPLRDLLLRLAQNTPPVEPHSKQPAVGACEAHGLAD